MPGQDIVLVRADTSDEVRLAFKNYFSDARDFIRMIEDGCTKLTKVRQLVRPARRQKKKKRSVHNSRICFMESEDTAPNNLLVPTPGTARHVSCNFRGESAAQQNVSCK